MGGGVSFQPVDHAPFFWSALSTSTGDMKKSPGNDGGLQPTLPPPDFPSVVWNAPRLVIADEPNSDRFSADDKTMATSARIAADHLSTDDASLRTPSRKSAIRSSSSARRLSADDESLVPTILSIDRYHNFQSILNQVMLNTQREPHLLLQTAPGLARTEDRTKIRI